MCERLETRSLRLVIPLQIFALGVLLTIFLLTPNLPDQDPFFQHRQDCPVPSPYQRPGECIADYPPDIKVVNFLAEARKIPMTSPAIISILKNTPVSWPLMLMYPPGELTEWILSEPWKKLLTEQGRQLIVVPMLPECVGKSQNCLAFHHDFWKVFDGWDYTLLFHADSALCTYKDYNLANFLHYDYIGAPWDHIPWKDVTIAVGNGGFGLRNIAFTRKCLQKVIDNKTEDEFFIGGYKRWPEDVWYGYCAHKYGRAASKQIAGHFAIENGRHSDWPLGLHQVFKKGHTCRAPWNNTFTKNCPESMHLFPGKC